MSSACQKLIDRYTAALQDYLLDPDRRNSEAYNLGRCAVEAGLKITEFVAVHNAALGEGLHHPHIAERSAQAAIQAMNFLEQSLLPFEQSCNPSQPAIQQAVMQPDRNGFAAIFEESVDAIFLVEPATNLTINCSNRAVELFEANSREDLIGIHGHTLHKHPFSTEEIAASIAVLSTKGVWSQEIEYATLRGNFFWGAIAVKLIHLAGAPTILVRITDISDRKHSEAEYQRTETALRQSEVRFQQMAASLPGVIYEGILYPGAPRYTYVSPGCRQLFEIEPTAILNDINSLWNMVCPEDLDVLRPEIDADRRGAQLVSREIRITTPSGQRKWLQVNAHQEWQVSGVMSTSGVITDITDRKQAEKALRQREIQYRAVIEDQTDLISRFLPDGKITFVNDAYCRYFNRSHEEMIGHAFMPFIPPEDRDIPSRTLASLTPENPIATCEHRVIAGNAEVRWMQWINRAIFDTAGNLIEFQGVGQDITDRKQTEIALRESEERFRQLAENIGSVFWMVDVADNLLYISPNCEQFWGKTAEYLHNIQREAWMESIYPDDLPNVEQAIASKLQTQGYDVEYRVIRSDQEMNWIHERAFPVRNEQGEIYRFAGIAEDITRWKQTEVKIQISLQEKETLLKEIHHRVKNNLQIVSALLSLQAEAVQHPRILAALRDSENRLRAMALIHEILYQSKDLQRLNFSSYIQCLADSILFANSTRPDSINLIYNLEPVFLNLETAIPCGLLLNELVTNALKHAFPDGRQGDISITLQHAANHYILSVQDNGIGIPETLNLENLKSLGLRIARDLSQQLRGTLELDRNSGTCFQLKFSELKYHKRF
jgi:PAS domain S-box-containing protein